MSIPTISRPRFPCCRPPSRWCTPCYAVTVNSRPISSVRTFEIGHPAAAAAASSIAPCATGASSKRSAKAERLLGDGATGDAEGAPPFLQPRSRGVCAAFHRFSFSVAEGRACGHGRGVLRDYAARERRRC